MSSVTRLLGSWVEPTSGRTYGYHLWQPRVTQALLVIIHGFGEHGGRYDQMASTLAEAGIFVAAPDLWGHGRSGGRRGDMGHASNCLADLSTLTTDVFCRASAQERYGLFGHSFGGLFVIQWAMRCASDRLTRLIVQSPLIEVGFPIPWWRQGAAFTLAVLWPSFSLSMNLDIDALSHDPAVVEAYRADHLVHNAMAAHTYRDILRTRDQILLHAADVKLPTLLLCGLEDRIVSIRAAQRWYKRLICEKRLITFPGCYHELHHEAVRSEILRLIQGWILGETATSRT